MMFTIPGNIQGKMVQQARNALPVEACGILSGRDGRVMTCHPMTNADGSSEHFMMVPAEQFAVAKAVRAAGEEILAVYHSHPNSPARPSPEDIRLALTPGVVSVIVSLAGTEPEVKAFRIENGHAEHISVQTQRPGENRP